MSSIPVVFGVSHVCLPVHSLARARSIYVDVLGFEERTSGSGTIELDAGGTVLLRLVETPRPEPRMHLRLMAPDIDVAVLALVRGGCTVIQKSARAPDMTLAASVCDPDGHTLTVWRALTEDEFDVVPELPKTLVWNDDADALLKQLLKGVPSLFRGLARRKVARVVEEFAAGHSVVTREDVIRGFIRASPKVTRGRNRGPLLDAGVDVDRYQADWDAD